jgi:hypothetical protein
MSDPLERGRCIIIESDPSRGRVPLFEDGLGRMAGRIGFRIDMEREAGQMAFDSLQQAVLRQVQGSIPWGNVAGRTRISPRRPV